MRSTLTNKLSRSSKQIIAIFSDTACITAALLIAGNASELITELSIGKILLVGASAIITTLLGLQIQSVYQYILRFSGSELIFTVARATTFSALAAIFVIELIKPTFENSLLFALLLWSLAATLLIGIRLIAREWLLGQSPKQIILFLLGLSHRKHKVKTKVVIYGAGASGRQLLEALRKTNHCDVVGFMDDDPSLVGKLVSGVKIFSAKTPGQVCQSTDAQQVLLAMPSATRRRRNEIINRLESLDVMVKTMPGMEELTMGLVKINEIRDIDVADVLGRDQVEPRQELLDKCIKDKAVMVTGAGGSIGSELCRQIILRTPKTLILFENAEYNLYAIHQEIEQRLAQSNLPTVVIPVLGSVTQPWRLIEILKKYNVHTIYHAAAYKHVPMVEFNSFHGFRNNTLGTIYTAQAAVITGVKDFVLISTDKAVRPTNIMGTTKRLAELALQGLNQQQTVSLIHPEKFLRGTSNSVIDNHTNFTMVRFGNVLESSGSVIPKFRAQIKSGGPITVTHKDIIRYFMTIPEAASLVIQAGAMGKGGDVFVLDMGQPVKIADLARKLVKLSGLQVRDEENPDGDIEIQYTGLRPGEKLYEELLIGNEAIPTDHEKIMRANELVIDWDSYKSLVIGCIEKFESKEFESIRSTLKSNPAIDYQPSSDIADWLYE